MKWITARATRTARPSAPTPSTVSALQSLEKASEAAKTRANALRKCARAGSAFRRSPIPTGGSRDE